MKIINKSSLLRGGFAGLKETRLIVDDKIGGDSSTSNGIGNFVYLADANFMPFGETRMHSHREIDVISIMVGGRVKHEGSLEGGNILKTGHVQAQRAGGEGFSHNEINPDNVENNMLQLWVLPETKNEPASYKEYHLEKNQLICVYGGDKSQTKTLDSHTIIEVALLERDSSIVKQGKFIAYIKGAEGEINQVKVKDGDFIQGNNLSLTVLSKNLHLTLITTAQF